MRANTQRFCALLVLLFLFVAGWEPTYAQTAAAQERPSAQASTGATVEHQITPQEAQALLLSVDSILKFDSATTSLPQRREVKRKLVSRDEVQKFVRSRLEDDEDAKRLRRSEAVLKKFGVLPGDFNLQSFLVDLLREQVAGYYDEKTRTVNLLDWLPAATQQPVMAHELTHALQDQNFGLEKWIREVEKEKKDPQQEVDAEEAAAARHAVVEGQAMAVMIDFVLAPTGGSLVNSPNIADAITHGMAEGGDSPVFQRAPLYLKKVLVFPYTYGLDFIRALLVKDGKDRAFAGVFKNPPLNTRQVMEPATYLAGEKLPPLPIPDFQKLLGKDYERYDVGSVGEFDVAVITEQFAGVETAKKIWPQWRGGYYYAARKKGEPGARLGLVYVSRWGTAESAQEFQRVYEDSIRKRYPGAELQGGDGGWHTREGIVRLARDGETVIVLESFDDATMIRLRQAIVSAGR